jgi:hypothetical protein
MQKYSELLKRYDDLKQYSITFPGDYSEQIVVDVGKVMNIPVDVESIRKILNTRFRKWGEESICFFHDSSNRSFILLDCIPCDWIFSITVRCTKESSKKVSEVLLNWFNYCLREEKQNIQFDKLDDNMFQDKNFLSETVRHHKLDTI